VAAPFGYSNQLSLLPHQIKVSAVFCCIMQQWLAVIARYAIKAKHRRLTFVRFLAGVAIVHSYDIYWLLPDFVAGPGFNLRVCKK
jgi:hypothetical protein